MPGHNFDCEIGRMVREFEILTHLLRIFSYRCLIKQNPTVEPLPKHPLMNKTCSGIIKEMVSLYETTVPNDRTGLTALNKAIVKLRSIRLHRNEIVHALFSLDLDGRSKTMHANIVKQIRNFEHEQQFFEFPEQALDKITICIIGAAEDFSYAIRRVNQNKPIAKALLNCTSKEFVVPNIQEYRIKDKGQ
ncbi:hypothetical protein [Nitrospira sp. M1]